MEDLESIHCDVLEKYLVQVKESIVKIVLNEIVDDHTAKIFNIFKEYIFYYLKSYERNKSITTSGFQSFLDKYYQRQGELLRSSKVNKGELTRLIKALNRSGLVDCMLPR